MTKLKKQPRFTFIDLFAGIGGFHLAMNNLKGKCVYASEWDVHARKTYKHNFLKTDPELFENDDYFFRGDITKPENKAVIPKHDILCGGFPCQPFSQAGFKRGFEEARGTLFYDVCTILQEKQPKAYFLENVRHLEKHDDGKTLDEIERMLRSLDYSFDYKIVKASDFGLPTHRPRIFIIGLHKSVVGNTDTYEFPFPEPIPLKRSMSDIFGGAKCNKQVGFTLRVGGRGSGLHDRRNWDAYLVNGKKRVLTPVEGKKMMGFPEDYEFPVSNAQAMKQLGNSVAVNAIEAVGKVLAEELDSYHESQGKQGRMERTIRIPENTVRTASVVG